MEADRLSRLDRQQYERDDQLVTGALSVFDQPVDGPRVTYERIFARVEGGLANAPRARQRIAVDALGPRWVDAADFELADHVRRVDAQSPVDWGRLEEICASILAEPFDLDRPLWRMDVVEGLDLDRLGLLFTSHHAIGDGQTTMALGAALALDLDPNQPLPEPRPWSPRPPTRLLSEAVSRITRLPGALSPNRVTKRIGTAVGAVRSVQRTRNHGGRSAPWNVACGGHPSVRFYSLELAEARRFGRALSHATVNDVLLAGVAGGLRAWLADREEELFDFRVAIPTKRDKIAVERGTDERGSEPSSLFVPLPVTMDRPLAQIHAVHELTVAAKARGEAESYAALRDAALALSGVPGVGSHLLPALLYSPGLFNLVVSNFPGLPVAAYMRGGLLRQVHPLTGAAGDQSFRITVSSTQDRLGWGIVSDWSDGPDLDGFVDGLDAWFDALRRSLDLLELVWSIPSFAGIAPVDQERLVAAMDRRSVGAGQDLVRQGETGEAFFVVDEGLFDVIVDGEVVRQLRARDSFGEVAMLLDVPRTATVRARTDASVYSLHRDVFLPVVTGDERAMTVTQAVIRQRAPEALG